MRRFFLLAAGFICFSGISFAQSKAEIKGSVIDSVTRQPVLASISVRKDSILVVGESTDDKGKFWIKDIEPGVYTIRISSTGYNTITYMNYRLQAGDVRQIDAQIKEGVDLGGHTIYDKKIGINPGNPTPTIIDPHIFKYGTQTGVLSVLPLIPNIQGRDGKFGSVNGSRQPLTIFINGVKIRNGTAIIPRYGVQSLQAFTEFIPAMYGDVVGGVIAINMLNISQTFNASVEARTSQFLDNFGHYYFSATATGPIIKRANKKTNDTNLKKIVINKPIMGFLVSIEAAYDKDVQPGANGWYRATDEVLNSIITDPLRLPPAGQSGTRYNSEYLNENDFTKSPYRMNAGSEYINLNAKLDFAPGGYTFFSIGGYLNYSHNKVWDINNSMFNWENNGDYYSTTWNVFGNFTHYFTTPKKDNDTKGGIRNAMINLQVDYLKGYTKAEDSRHQDRFYDYGYVGKFDIYRRPTFTYGYDGTLDASGYLFSGYEDTLVRFTPGNTNPQIASITSAFYDLYPVNSGQYNQLSSITSNGGVINGYVPRPIYDLYNCPGTPYNLYQISNNNQFHFNVNGSATIGDHDINMGFEFEQRNDGFYQLNPVRLWTVSRLLTNSHLGTIDTASAYAAYDSQGNYNDTIWYNALYQPDPNRPGFGLGQTFFDYNLRNKLGLSASGLDIINVDGLDPSFLNINMLSADELYNNGDVLVVNSGYDVYGNEISGNSSLQDFFTAKDQYGNYARPISAFQPNYMGGYIQDRFSIKDLYFNVGIRVDRYDANQPVLKDPFSLYDTRKVGDVMEMAGTPVQHPGNAESDWVVYVDDINNPTKILGYRDGNTWYNESGEVITDPTVLRNSSGRVQPYLTDPNADVRNPGPGLFNAFTDYTPQVNVMPRIMFSFKLSEHSMFEAYFNMLSQRPTLFNGNRNLAQSNPMDYLFWDNTAYNSSSTYFNNPNLRPEKTTDFAVSFTQVIGSFMKLRARAFYRELRDMIAAVKYQEAYPRTYTAWSNIDFATVKGFTVESEMRTAKDNFRMNASYTLQFADGTGSNSFSQLNLINSGTPNLRSTIPLAYDTRHQFKLLAMLNFGENRFRDPTMASNYIGPQGKFLEAIFRNLNISFSMYGNSGTPYSQQIIPTPTQLINGSANGSLLGSLNGARLPFEMYCDLNISKDIPLYIRNKAGKERYTSLQLYFNVQNLFALQNIINVYSATGSASDDGYLTAPNYQSQVASQVDPASYTNYYSMKMNNPYNYSMPPRIRLGVVMNF